jgi:hypothetical protein
VYQASIKTVAKDENEIFLLLLLHILTQNSEENIIANKGLSYTSTWKKLPYKVSMIEE